MSSATVTQTKPEARPIRRLVAETVGTFFLVIVSAGVGIVSELHPGEMPTSARAVAPGLVVAALIYALGSVSGAHFNPAVTLAFAVRTVFPWRWVPAYIGAELAGAIGAAGVLHVLFDPTRHGGTTYPHGDVAESLGLEVLLTALLVFVVLSVATQHRLLGPDAALPTAATIVAAHFVGLSVSGASMNPARSLGPAIVSGMGHDQWIYVVGPCVGALAATVVATMCHGLPDEEERDAAQGDES